VTLYRPMLVRFARARSVTEQDAEDIAQQCLESISKHIRSFEYDRQRGGFKRWLHTLVNNRVRNLLRQRRERVAESADFKRPQERERPPEEIWEQLWLQEHVRYCLAKIRERVEDRTFRAFEFRTLREWPVDRVCQVLDMTPEQVHVAKSRVTRHLREMMSEMLAGTN